MDKDAILPSTGKQKPGFFYGYIIVFIAFFVLVIMHGLLYSFGVFLKPMSAELDWTRAMPSGAYSMGLFVTGLLFMVTGRLNDRLGPRIVATICGFCVGLGCLLISQVSVIWQLYLFWGLMVAIGFSGGFVPMTSTVARWFVKKQGMMTGIVAAGAGVGTIIIPPVASWLISSYGWRTSFTVIGITALVLLVSAAQFLKRDPGKIGQLPYGLNEPKQENPISRAGGFSFREATHTRQFWIICAIYFFSYGYKLAVMLHIVPHATDLGISPLMAANILATIGGLSIAGRVGIGSISDKVGRKSSLIVCLILAIIALLWLQIASELWMFYLFAVIFGFSTGGLVALESPLTAELFGMRAHGAILGTIIFSAVSGGAISSLSAGHMFDITGSYNLAMWVYAAFAIASLILALLLKPTRWQGQSLTALTYNSM